MEELQEMPFRMLLECGIWNICQGGRKYTFTSTPVLAEGWDGADSPPFQCH